MIDRQSEYIPEPFVPGDEVEIVKLFNAENEKLAGFVPRTVDYWRWCCLNRPDVDSKSIVVVKDKSAIIGYVVVGRSGNVWELCYDSKREGKGIVSALLTWALEHAKNVNSDSLVLNAYIKDKVVCEVCDELDFAQSPSEPLFVSVLDLAGLISAILGQRKSALRNPEVFWFKLKNCPPWCVDSFGIKLSGDQVSVLTKNDGSSSVMIEADMTTLVSLILGEEKVAGALLSGKVRFAGFLKIFKGLKLLNSLKNKAPWYIPRADIA